MPTSLGKNNGQHLFFILERVLLLLVFESTVLNVLLEVSQDYVDVSKKEKVTNALRISQFPVDKD